MRPVAAISNVSNQALANPVKEGEGLRRLSRQSSNTYLDSLLGGQFSPLTALLAHVFVIVSKRSEKQMGESNATSHVASVKDWQLRCFPGLKFPCDPVHGFRLTASVVQFTVAAFSLFPVLASCCSSPQPTISPRATSWGFVDLRPKAKFKRTMNMYTMFRHWRFILADVGPSLVVQRGLI